MPKSFQIDIYIYKCENVIGHTLHMTYGYNEQIQSGVVLNCIDS